MTTNMLNQSKRCMILYGILVILMTGLHCQQLQSTQQKTVNLNQVSRSLVINQHYRFYFDPQTYKYAYSLDLDDGADSVDESNQNQSNSTKKVLSSCEEIQRTIENHEEGVYQFELSDYGLNPSDGYIGFGKVGQFLLAVSKHFSVTLFKINSSTNDEDDGYLQFLSTFKLTKFQAEEYASIAIQPFRDNYGVIVTNSSLIFVDVNEKKIQNINLPSTSPINYNQAITSGNTIMIPLSKLGGILVISIEDDQSSQAGSNKLRISSYKIVNEIGSFDLSVITEITVSKNFPNVVYLLDYSKGLIISNINLDALYLNVPEIIQSYQLDSYENKNDSIATLIILQQTTANSQAIEIYVDFSSLVSKNTINDQITLPYEIGRDFKLNQSQLKSVIAFDHFCLFTGKNSHTFEYHSTRPSNSYYTENRIPYLFTQDTAVNTIVLSPVTWNQDNYNNKFDFDPNQGNFLVMILSEETYSVYSITPISPMVECIPTVQQQLGIITYNTTVYSTKCPGDKAQSLFTECKIVFPLEIEVTEVLIDDSNSILAAGIVLGSLLLVVLIMVGISNGIRKHKARISGLEREIKNLSQEISPLQNIKYSNLKEEEQGSE